MKTIAKSIILIAVMLLYGSCSKIVQESPETITISGHITDEDGQPVENVSLDLMYITRMNLLGFYYGTGIHAKTDENGYYSIQRIRRPRFAEPHHVGQLQCGNQQT